MKFSLKAALLGAAMFVTPTIAQAAGELQIYNWGNYTSMEMIAKFEKEYDVKVTITDYDSNDDALAKVRAGGHGFDMAVPSANFVPIWISEGLLLETNPNQMPNYKNVDPKWLDVPYDAGHKYSVPWQWGTTGVVASRAVYSGDVDTSNIVFNPPPELEGKINVVPEMNDVMALAIMNQGGEPCSGDKELLKKVRDLLVAAKPKWISMDYATTDKFAKGDLVAGLDWNGNTLRARLLNDKVAYGYPKEGYVLWMDNLVVLKDAKNVENAKAFQNFMMDPENAAMLSMFARYANGIAGSDKFMDDTMRTARAVNVPAELADKGRFIPACNPDIVEIYSKIWTEVLK